MLPAPASITSISTRSIPTPRSTSTCRQFPSTSKTTWGGMPALASPNDVLILFRSRHAADDQPQSAIWHFGWHVPDMREPRNLQGAAGREAPAALHERRGRVRARSAATPGPPRAARRADEGADRGAKAKGDKPKGGGGFAYMQGPTTRSSNISATIRPSA